MNLLLDISRIPTQLGGLSSLTKAIALAMLVFLIPYTLLENGVKAISGKERPDFSGMLVRCLMTVAALLCYERIFYFVAKLSQIMSFAILSEEQWGNFLVQSFHGMTQGEPTLNILIHPVSSIQEIILFLSSLVAVTARDVIVMLQACFLSLLFAFGPIAIVCSINPKSAQVTRGWIANTFQVAFWSFFLRLVVRVWLSLNPLAGVDGAGWQGAGWQNDYLGILTVNVTFLLMVLGTPIVAARLLSGESLAMFGEAAMASVQTIMIARKLGAGMAIGRAVDRYKRASPEEKSSFYHHPIPSLAKTATRAYKDLFHRDPSPKPAAPQESAG